MRINVQHIAQLANLPISDKEIPMFEKQLSEVLDYVKQLDQLDTKDIKETSQVTGLENVTRPDNPEPSLLQEQALSNAHATKDGKFQVKGIFNDE